MLASTRWFVALHLLCITNIAKPLVLLTANVDDIKKIARKFISENFADKIADFIVKAGVGVNDPKISAENDENADDIQIASNEKKTIGRSGRKKTTTPREVLKDYEDFLAKKNAKKDTAETTTVDSTDDGWFGSIFKTTEVQWNDEVKKTKTSKTSQGPEDHTKRKSRPARNANKVEDSVQFITEPANEDSGKGIDFGPFVEDAAMNYPKGEENDVDYPKEELVATSGPVVLPKIAESLW